MSEQIKRLPKIALWNGADLFRAFIIGVIVGVVIAEIIL